MTAETGNHAVAAEDPEARMQIGPAFKDAAIAALVAFGLFAPIMGFRTIQLGGRIVLDQNWMSVAWAVGIVFFGRLAVRLFWNPMRVRRRGKIASPAVT